MSRKHRRNGKKNVSDKMVAANQQNALLSTGPVSQEGKAASAMNALDHGGYSTQKVLLRWECPQHFATYHQQLWDYFNPQTSLENELVDTYIWESWRIRRFRTLEARVFDELESASVEELQRQLEKYSRLKMRAERSRDKAHKHLQSLRTPAASPVETGERARTYAEMEADYIASLKAKRAQQQQQQQMPPWADMDIEDAALDYPSGMVTIKGEEIRVLREADLYMLKWLREVPIEVLAMALDEQVRRDDTPFSDDEALAQEADPAPQGPAGEASKTAPQQQAKNPHHNSASTPGANTQTGSFRANINSPPGDTPHHTF